ncbi:MAG: ferrous iron transport protein A [Eggerthellaceae bacterium]|nr:ferrous iron transport protein A [Eggerthellaceae bacterium]
MTLTDLAVGQTAVIEDIVGERIQRMKLLDVGLVPQTKVTVRKIAPMGDPIEVGVRSYVLTLRKAEAALIVVKQEEGA